MRKSRSGKRIAIVRRVKLLKSPILMAVVEHGFINDLIQSWVVGLQCLACCNRPWSSNGWKATASSVKVSLDTSGPIFGWAPRCGGAFPKSLFHCCVQGLSHAQIKQHVHSWDRFRGLVPDQALFVLLRVPSYPRKTRVHLATGGDKKDRFGHLTNQQTSTIGRVSIATEQILFRHNDDFPLSCVIAMTR
jgi:hypothetical protein